ncbi:uncharacterized protein [Scyliorhinus torazame]|uniref:uncharacterized protein n=1 Tax=Scyliorhinus torazame TaxID=75743 RepID=UPI003B5A8DDC
MDSPLICSGAAINQDGGLGNPVQCTPSTSPSPIPSTNTLDEAQDPELATFAIDDLQIPSAPFSTIGKIKPNMESPVCLTSSFHYDTLGAETWKTHYLDKLSCGIFVGKEHTTFQRNSFEQKKQRTVFLCGYLMGLCSGKSSCTVASALKKEDINVEDVESARELESFADGNFPKSDVKSRSGVSTTADSSNIKPNSKYSSEKMVETVSYVNENDGLEIIDID